MRDGDGGFPKTAMDEVEAEAEGFESGDSLPEAESTDFEPEFQSELEPDIEPSSSPAGPEDFQVSRAEGPEPETMPPFQAEATDSGVETEAVRTLPGTGRSEVVESFADIETGGETEEGVLAPASEAASVPVPVDMVEKIAQRVVAQVSEKVVREIVWEVVPDLAEALIKREIERLKAELDNL
jgi:hypothetical protein